ncbi:MAG TPA: malonyl-CoA synthase [Acidimicrobiia bacterium]|nr:malonyl-CoA synthase [Acidimicrobiia bacterium]
MTEAATLTELFDLAGRDPDAVFIDVPDGTAARPAVYTYGDALRGSAQLAHALTSLGAGPGDRVAVQVEKSPLAVLLYLACVRSGAVLVPMNTAYSDAEVEYLLGDAEPAVVVCDPVRAGSVRAPHVVTADARGDGSLAELAAAQPDTFDDVDRTPDDLAAILYTSGTTGRPKGAMLSQRNLTSNAVALHRVWGFRPDDVLLHALPIFHTHGLFVATNCVLANGTGMVFLPRFDVDAVVAQIARCTVFMGVPTYYTRLLADPRFDADLCAHVRLFVSGSAPLLASTHDEFFERTGHAILERYGMTETGMLTSNPLDGDRRPGTVGFGLPGVDVRVVSDGGIVCRPGEIGGVEVRGPNVFSGYWRRPELAATEFTADGFFRTGDLGTFDGDGYLTIVGRSKDLVISGGLNVYPKEVEDVLDALDGVVESAVVGVPDADLGEAVVAVVVAEPGATVDEAGLRAAARERLAGYKVPKRVHVVDALPRNTMGKVEKARLRERFVNPP